jgi:hypothetical protein
MRNAAAGTGRHPKLVQETLGHSTYQLTMDTYSHMIPQLRNEVADRMDEILSPTNGSHQNDVGQVAVMIKLLILLVPGGGLEPPRPCGLRILSPLRLPISPSGHCRVGSW